MQELSLKEVQSVSLEILLDIHRFCIEHNLNYSLAYGTLIGAIRHKGFIPWDDDVDIVMPRPDFDIFCETFSSKENSVIFYGNDKSSIACFARVSDMKKTFFETDSCSPWTSTDSGVWVDVFPLDGVEERQTEYAKRYYRLKKLCSQAYWYRKQNHKIASDDPLFLKVRTLFFKLIGLKGFIASRIVLYIVNRAKTINYSEAEYIGQLTCFDDGPIQFCKSDFSSYIDVDFENAKMKVMAGYDHHLKQLYGDYMILPSEEDRVPKQYWLHYFWRN